MPPYPVPVLRLARLAVGREDRGRGIGRRLLRFVLDLAGKMRDELGCVGVVVDAKPGAAEYYRSCGFVEIGSVEGGSPIRPAPTAMFLPLGSVARKRTEGGE